MNLKIKKTSAELDPISTITEIEKLRPYYYSDNLNETFEAIQALKKMNTVDASRELIQIYNDSLWRKIKIEVISALGSHNNQRTLEFLCKIANSDEDLSLAQLSIEALGQIDNVVVSRFLEQLYLYGHKSKKPDLILSLVKQCYLPFLKNVTADLSEALINKDFSLAKNLIYAIGELRSHDELNSLKLMIGAAFPKDIQLSAISSVAKISRNANDLSEYASLFKHDAFEFQIYQQSQQQLIFRSQWKLEDYLNKLFNSENYHKSLPLELNSFNETDVISGLELFFEEKHFSKIIHTLGLLKFEAVFEVYDKLIDVLNLESDLVYILENSILKHRSNHLQKSLDFFKRIDLQTHIKLSAFCLPENNSYLKNFLCSDDYKQFSDKNKISFLNTYVDYLFCFQKSHKMITSSLALFENELQIENSVLVKNRIIRLLGQISFPQGKVFNLFKSKFTTEEYEKSVLFYIEHQPSFQAINYLKENVKKLNQKNSWGFFKAYIAQDISETSIPEIETLIIEKIQTEKNEAVVATYLKTFSVLFQKKVLVDFKKYIDLLSPFLKNQSNLVVLNAILAFKFLQTEGSSDLLIPLLDSKNESIKGRTLDALLFHNTVRSFRICIDYLKNNVDQHESIEKILRHFKQISNKTNIKTDYCLKTFQDVIKNNPEHKLAISLKEVITIIQQEKQEDQLKNQIPTGADLVAIDQEILKNLKKYHEYDESVKASLRSAEVPFSKPDLFDKYVDKSVCILGYTKAIDIFLEKQFGQKLVLPKLEERLFEFQNIIHNNRLGEDYPDQTFVLKNLQLEKYFSPQSLPVHKMTLIGKSILSSKILNDQFKTLDGLRAWGIILLLFCRKNLTQQKAILQINLEENDCIDLAKKLMALQDLRNPVAHRHTLTRFEDIKGLREDCFKLLATLEKVFLK